jgi:hypothetical protein
MRPFLSTFLTGTLIVGLLNLPVMAAEKPVGVVLLSESGHLDKAVAAPGADIFSGDGVYTDEGGTLRVKVGSSQIYLLSASSGSFGRAEKMTEAHLITGTMGLSATPTDPVEITTKFAMVRPTGDDHAFGQVTMTGATAMTVSVYRGSLVVSNGNGQEQTIREGQTYNVRSVPDPEAAPAGGAPSPGVASAFHPSLLVFTAVSAAALGVVAGVLYHHFENGSPSIPPSQNP